MTLAAITNTLDPCRQATGANPDAEYQSDNTTQHHRNGSSKAVDVRVLDRLFRASISLSRHSSATPAGATIMPAFPNQDNVLGCDSFFLLIFTFLYVRHIAIVPVKSASLAFSEAWLGKRK